MACNGVQTSSREDFENSIPVITDTPGSFSATPNAGMTLSRETCLNDDKPFYVHMLRCIRETKSRYKYR